MLLDTPLCNYGWQAPDFTLKDPGGVAHRMVDYLGEKGLLVAFICNHCPYVKRIAGQLAMDTRVLMDEGINVLAVMSNDYKHYEADSPKNMQAFAKKYGFAFPYLVDEDQSVARQYDAVCTPDFFGLNSKGELQYRGRLDNSNDAVGDGVASERVPELLEAMRLIAQTGRGPREQRASMGCSIKWRQAG